MPRKPRFYLPGVPVHAVQRGNCRQAVFFCDEDYTAYLNWLQEGAERHGCAIHAWVLMTNHVHLLVTPTTCESVSRMVQFVGRHYVTYINRRYRKSGTLWEGRHKGCLVQDERYLLACMRYIELNPVRAGMVAAPGEYRWSSYHDNAVGSEAGMVQPHSVYRALGKDAASRGAFWKDFFSSPGDPDQLRNIRDSVQSGTPLGNDRFREQIAQTLGCRIGHTRQGRPSRSAEKGTDPL